MREISETSPNSKNKPFRIPCEQIVDQFVAIANSKIYDHKNKRISDVLFDVEKGAIRIIRSHGVDIVFYDFEYLEADHQSAYNFNTLLSLPNTKIVVAEYFGPELRQNANMMGLGAKYDKTLKDQKGWGRRIDWANTIADSAKIAKKSVATVDIANKPTYMFLRDVAHLIPLNSLLANSLHPLMASGIIAYDLFTLLGFIKSQCNVDGNFIRDFAGITDPEKIHLIEKLLPDWENARRVIAAKGIDILASQYKPKGTDGSILPKDRPMIFVPQPKAHNIREERCLLNPMKIDKINEAFSRIGQFIPGDLGLDFSVRIWEYKNQLDALSKDGQIYGNNHTPLDGWRKITV